MTNMARTKIIPTEGLLSDLEHTSVIVSYSNGIDSMGVLYWAVSIRKIYHFFTRLLHSLV